MITFAKSNIPFAKTESFEKLLIDYINDKPFLANFYGFDDSIEGIQERIRTYSNKRLNRLNLVSSIRNQYAKGGISELAPEISENLKLLESPKTFTITTGHQLNIFSGPLYVLYKLISAINMARSLNLALPDYKFVPVYWMATEDHDMEEISSINLFGNNIKWNTTWKGMSGKAPLNDFHSVISELSNALSTSPFQKELTELIEMSYSNTENLADATRKWVNTLFSKYGLVIIDGNSSILKSQFSDVMLDELINRSSSKLVHESTRELKNNYHLQVNPRDINLFYSGDTFRSRIVSDGTSFNVLNTDLHFSNSAITEEMKVHPENFSPNVILRPLYQESILPNVAFTGGPAEIAYWLELKSVFNHYDVPLPALFMRSSVLIIDSTSATTMKKYSISNSEIFSPIDEIVKKVITKDENYSLDRILKMVSGEMDILANEIALLDSSLRSTVESEKQRMINSLQTLEQKIIRAAKKKNEIDVNRLRKLKERLFPNEKLQERELSVLSFLLNKGPEFIDALIGNLNPLEKQFVILEELTS